MFCRQQWPGKPWFLKEEKNHPTTNNPAYAPPRLYSRPLTLTELFTDFYHLFHQNCSSFMELCNGHLGQPHLSTVVHFRAEDCNHSHASRSRRALPLAVHCSGNLSLGIYAYSYIIPNRNRKDQQREPEFKKKLLPLSNSSNLHQNYPSSVTLLQEFLDPFLSQLQRRNLGYERT